MGWAWLGWVTRMAQLKSLSSEGWNKYHVRVYATARRAHLVSLLHEILLINHKNQSCSCSYLRLIHFQIPNFLQLFLCKNLNPNPNFSYSASTTRNPWNSILFSSIYSIYCSEIPRNSQALSFDYTKELWSLVLIAKFLTVHSMVFLVDTWKVRSILLQKCPWRDHLKPGKKFNDTARILQTG